MNQKLWLESLWDEWLASSSSQSQSDYEASGLLMGMKHQDKTFTTNRIRAARRLTGPGKIKLWSLTSYYANHNIPLSISMTTRKNYKPSIKFTCPHEILKLPKNINSSWSWLKGLWGSTGGLYFPKSGYYLTLRITDAFTSDITRGILNLTGLSWKEYRNEFTLRNHEDIMTFLHKAGMTSGALEFDSMVMMRSLKSRVNLERNYDAANIARSVNAARKQLELSRRIIAEGLLESLPENLREVIELRLAYPDESLEGLGEKLKRKIKKSAVKYRWNKIQKLIVKN